MRTLLIVGGLCLAACGDSGAPLTVDDVELTAPMPGNGMRAGYMTFHNNSDQDIAISSVTSNAYERVEIHRSSVENGVARMRPVPVLNVPAGESVELRRGGLHLMLMRPVGDTSFVSLQMYAADQLLLTIESRHMVTTE